MASYIEVPNKGQENTSFSASVIHGSEEDFDVICHACVNSDILKKAEVFCKNCKECLCRDCHIFHKKLTATKKHEILDLSCNPCANDDVHVEGDVFCKNCKEFLCERCQTFHGRLTATRSHTVVSVVNFVEENSPKEKERLREIHVVTNSKQTPSSPITQQVRPSIITTLTDHSVETHVKSPAVQSEKTVNSLTMATEPGGNHTQKVSVTAGKMSLDGQMPADVFIPVGLVKALENLPGGINALKHDLQQNHLIDVKYTGSTLCLSGPNEKILDLAIEFLHVKVGRAYASNITLGGKGTVAWSYRGKSVKLIMHLFHEEYKELLAVKSIKTTILKVDCLDISCSYADYRTVNDMLEKLDKNIKNCKQKAVKLDVKEQQLAKKFEKEQSSQLNVFYCCLLRDKKDKSKVELEFYGREEMHCQEGILIWETIRTNPIPITALYFK